MKVTTEELENCQIGMTIEIEDAEVEKALRKSARKLSRHYKIPGFRPGKAPYNIIVRQLGIEVIQQQTLDDLGEKLYKQALKEKEIEPYAPASLDEVTWAPLALSLTIPMPPRVDLGAYREVRVTSEEATVTDEQVNQVLEGIRKQNAMREPVERPAQLGDVVTLDIEATVNGEIVFSGDGHEILVGEDSRYPVPGFGKALVGTKAGEEKEFELPYPEDYYNQDLAGRQASFHVVVDSVKEEVLPAVDDPLAMTVGYESADELIEEIRTELLKQAQQATDERFMDAVFDRVIEGASIAFPPIVVDREIDGMIEEQDHYLQQRGMTLAEFLEMRNQTEEDLREDLRPQAEERTRRSLILSEVVETERLKLEEHEVSEEIERRSLSMGEHADALRAILSSPQGMMSVSNSLLTQKALERLRAIATGEAPELESEESVEENVEETGESASVEETLAEQPVTDGQASDQQSEPVE